MRFLPNLSGTAGNNSLASRSFLEAFFYFLKQEEQIEYEKKTTDIVPGTGDDSEPHAHFGSSGLNLQESLPAVCSLSHTECTLK